MPTFAYTARSRDGRVQRGTMDAQNRTVLLQSLRDKGLIPEQRSIKEKRSGGRMKQFTSGRVRAVEIMIFTRQLSTMVNAGLPLLQSLDILAEQTEDVNFSKIIKDIASNVEGGETLSDALKLYPRVFPDLYVSMVRSGEVSGDLDGVLIRLAEYMEATAELKRKVRGAMVYPLVSLTIILMIAAGLILFVVPQFERIFTEMGATLPAPTRILIQVSDWIRSWRSMFLVAGFVGAIVAYRAYNATPAGKYQIDGIKLRLPIFGMLMRKVAISRFTRTLATLTRSGVAILQALEIAERTSGNEVFAKAIRTSADCVRNGETLADPLSRTTQFPPMVTRMIGVGEKTGALETMLEKIADFYDSEVKALVDSLTSLLEPMLLVVMGIIVGGIIVALFMPILNLSQIVK